MRCIDPGGETRPVPPLLSPERPSELPRLGIDRLRLPEAISLRRVQIAALEAEWVAACECAAGLHRSRRVVIEDRTTWDKPMWDNYLAAAANLEAQFMLRMRRLHGEIARLERLLAALPATSAHAP